MASIGRCAQLYRLQAGVSNAAESHRSCSICTSPLELDFHPDGLETLGQCLLPLSRLVLWDICLFALAALAGGNVTFTPHANFYDNASFQYTVSDGQEGTTIATGMSP